MVSQINSNFISFISYDEVLKLNPKFDKAFEEKA